MEKIKKVFVVFAAASLFLRKVKVPIQHWLIEQCRLVNKKNCFCFPVCLLLQSISVKKVAKEYKCNHESAIHNSGNVVLKVLWDFSRGGAYSVFRWETRKKKKLCKLRRQRRQWRPDLTPDMRVRSSREKRCKIVSYHVSLSCCLHSPYPHLHKHIQARHGRAIPTRHRYP